jgi:hypothetical protein
MIQHLDLFLGIVALPNGIRNPREPGTNDISFLGEQVGLVLGWDGMIAV